MAYTGTGTSTNVLEAQAAGTLPTFGPNTGVGNWVLIQSQSTGGAASVTFTSGITNTYNVYILVISNMLASAGTPTGQITLSTDGGGTYLNSGYSGGTTFNFINGAATWSNSNSTSIFTLGGVQNATHTLNATIWFYNMTNGNEVAMQGTGFSNGSFSLYGGSQSTGTINAIKINLSAGNISGTFSLYGLLE